MAQAAMKKQNVQQPQARPKGRPRSVKSKQAILKATNTLLLRMSVQELSIEAIAKKAKVGKTTIYRWWPNKSAVVMEALVNQPGMQSPAPTANSHAEAIQIQLEKLIRLLDSNNGQTIAQLLSEAQGDDKAREVVEKNFMKPLIDAIQYSVEEGQKRGEFSGKLDSSMVTDMLCGPIFFRLLAHPEDLTGDFQKNYAKEILRLISA